MALNPITVEELQISAVHDDGTPEGIIRTKLEQGDLVKVPIRNNAWTGGSAQATIANNDGSFERRVLNNSNPISLSSTPGYMYGILSGRVIGIRIEKNGNFPDFAVVIDGTAYRVSQTTSNYNTNLIVNGVRDTESYIIVATDLEDKPHQVEIFIQAAATLLSINVLGFIAEKRAGYSDTPLKSSLAYSQGVLTTSAVALSRSTNIFGVKRIRYYNPDTVSHTITVINNSKVWDKLTLATLTAGEVILDPVSMNILNNGSGDNQVVFTHQVDAVGGAAIEFTIIGGC